MRILLLLLVVIVLGYLLIWPTPVAPKAWEAPADPGYVGVHARNERLSSMQTRAIAPFLGPEALALTADGNVLTGTESGELLEIDAAGKTRIVSRLGGRPLGLAIAGDGRIYVANAGIGLQRVTPDGKSQVLARRFAGAQIAYANSVAIAPDGLVYFTDSSTHFNPEKYGGTLEASVLDLLEHDPNGRLFRYDPESNEVDLILDRLQFPNGVAVDPSGEFLLLAETGHYRVLKVWLGGREPGLMEPLIENLPGFPDNLSLGQDGRYWLGLAAPRKALLDSLDGSPFLRKMVARLPPVFRPQAEPYAHVIAINADGDVLTDLQSSLGPLYTVTGAVEGATNLYISTLHGPEIGVIPKLALER